MACTEYWCAYCLRVIYKCSIYGLRKNEIAGSWIKVVIVWTVYKILVYDIIGYVTTAPAQQGPTVSGGGEWEPQVFHCKAASLFSVVKLSTAQQRANC